MIRFEQVDLRFSHRPPGPWVLQGFDLSIATGEFHLLLGPSGCGKTTALNLLAGFERATRGRIIVDERIVDAPGVDRIVIFQGDDSLYPWLTALENVEFGLRVAGIPLNQRREKALEYLRLVGLQGQEAKYPYELSGGMKKRIQIARALVCESPILLMDEPFAAVDAQTRSILQEELNVIWQRTKCTIFFITHDISEAILLADRISVMKAGPGSSVKETLAVDMPRPRSPSHSVFGQIYERVQKILAGEVRKVTARGSVDLEGQEA